MSISDCAADIKALKIRRGFVPKDNEYYYVVADMYDPDSGVNGIVFSYGSCRLLLFGDNLYYRVYRSDARVHSFKPVHFDCEIAINGCGQWSIYRVLESGDAFCEEAKSEICRLMTDE